MLYGTRNCISRLFSIIGKLLSVKSSSNFLYLFRNSSNNLHELHIVGCPHCQGESSQRSGLVEGSQTDGDIEEEGGDPQPHLAPAHGSQGQGSTSDVRGQAGGPAGLHGRGRDEEEGGDAQQAVVELDTGRVLRDVPHCGGELQQILRNPAVSKFGETIIDQAGVQTSNKGSWQRNYILGRRERNIDQPETRVRNTRALHE